ncbi:MAG: superoxide dismutase family protein [Myxococcota bacterium]|nr:superoxide dismutase family protein [Myxococcota bacterium]
MRKLMIMVALTLGACGGGDAQGEPAEATSSGGEGDTQVDVIAPEGPIEPAPVAVAEMRPTEGNAVEGTVRFQQQGQLVRVQVDLTGLPPQSRHGFHVHENGDCSAPDGTSAGGHYNPGGHDHALPDGAARHAGDMGNVEADISGEVHVELAFETFSVNGDHLPPVTGRAVIVHADPDDGGQPTGNAGARVACGVITLVE